MKGDVGEFARILGEGWENKKKMAGAITNPMIQEAFDVATGAGAMAGKVSGAGGEDLSCLWLSRHVKKKWYGL